MLTVVAYIAFVKMHGICLVQIEFYFQCVACKTSQVYFKILLKFKENQFFQKNLFLSACYKFYLKPKRKINQTKNSYLSHDSLSIKTLVKRFLYNWR